MKQRSVAIILATSTLLASGASAEEATLTPVTVTARPVIEEVAVDRFASSSAVVTRDQLRDQNAVDLAAALRRTPGVQKCHQPSG